MEQWLAGGSCLLSLLLVLSTIAAGKSMHAAIVESIPSSKPGGCSNSACLEKLQNCVLCGPCWHAGWMVLWHTTLKDIGFFREIMGLNRYALIRSSNVLKTLQSLHVCSLDTYQLKGVACSMFLRAWCVVRRGGIAA
jgi:hypothetical protein